MKIIGVHLVETLEPCYLIEIEFDEPCHHDFDWGEITQEEPNQPSEAWEMPWDEQPIDDDELNWVFFFHYLDLSKPLITPFGDLPLPKPTPLPEHLEGIEYEEP